MTTPHTADFEAGRHAAVAEILEHLDIVKTRCLGMTDQRASACARMGLSMACLAIGDIENRWVRPAEPLHDRMSSP